MIFTTLLTLFVILHECRALCNLGDNPIVLTSWNGTLGSPKGDTLNRYASNQECEWQIKVSQGSRVRLTFRTFDLEDGYFFSAPAKGNISCNDVVKVYEDTNTLFTGCQSEGLGRTLESSDNILYVRFISDENIEKAGFTASYEGICSKNISESSFIESPGYPESPPDGVQCTWNMISLDPKLMQILYLRPDENDTAHALLSCGSSALKWQTTRDITGLDPMRDKELCRENSRIVTNSDVQLTYQPPPGTNASWTGRLYLDLSSNLTSGCERYCDHGFDCVRNLIVDPGNYRCLCQRPYSGRNCEVYTNPCNDANNCSGAGICNVTDDGSNFTCTCQPGYTGYRCEAEIDPCVGLLCQNGGQCRKHNATTASCDCPPGFEPPDCQPAPTSPTTVATTDTSTAAPRPCDSSPCQHGGTCSDEAGQEEYRCVCPTDYTGSTCSLLTGEGHCLAEVDDVVGSGIRWKDTRGSQHDYRDCPPGSTGLAERYCMLDERSPTGGFWRRPDLSACVSPELVQLQLKSKALTREGADSDALYNVTRHLDNVTSVLQKTPGQGAGAMPSAPGSGRLFPGDLLLASEVLANIAAGVVNARSVEEDPPSLAQHFTSSIGNVLHLSALDIWKNAKVQLVHNKMTSILTSAQQFAENLIARQQGTTVIARDVVSTEGLTLLATGVDNVDLTVTHWYEADKAWSPVGDLDPDVPSKDFSTLRLPPDILRIARGDGSSRNVTFYTGRFKSLAPLLSLKEGRYTREEDDNLTQLAVVSDVVSAEVLNLPKTAFSKLQHPVQITFKLTEPMNNTNAKKHCVFMNMSTSDPESRWLNDSCYVDAVTSTHVTCACYHLTNFAVLLDVYDNAATLDSANDAALSFISYIGGSLSILACVVVIAVFEYFRLSNDRVRIHEQLAVSITAVQILFLIGVGRTTSDHTTPKWACKTVAILLHYFLTALFCWMLVEGIHIYVLLVKVFKRGSHLKKYCAIGWGVPFIIVGISVGVFYGDYGDNNICRLTHQQLLVCFVPTVALVVLINTVILILVLRVMLKSLNSTARVNTDQVSSIRTSLKASAVLLPLLGLTWTLGFLAVGTGDTKVLVYIFTYLFTICNSFQGVLFFVFHCLLNVDVHNAYERRYRQRKRAASSLENTTRKSSEAFTFLPDSTLQGKSISKSSISDMSVIHRKPITALSRFSLFDQHLSNQGSDPTLPGFDTRISVYPPSSAAEGLEFPDGHSTVFEDVQASDKDRIWRRYSWGHEAGDDLGFRSTSAHTQGNTRGNNSNNYSNGNNHHQHNRSSNTYNGILHHTPSFPSRHRSVPDVAAMASGMHGDLDVGSFNNDDYSVPHHRLRRPNSVHFSPD